jgi:hypothetical protein
VVNVSEFWYCSSKDSKFCETNVMI